MITCLEEDNLDNIINNGIYLLEFYSEDCASCSFVGPIIESLSEYIDIIKIDVNKFKYLADEIAVKEDGQIVLDVTELGYNKVLAKGSLSTAMVIKSPKFSQSAIAKIEEVGGIAEII